MLKIKSMLCVFLNQGSHKDILQCFPNTGLTSQRQIRSVAPVLHRISPFQCLKKNWQDPVFLEISELRFFLKLPDLNQFYSWTLPVKSRSPFSLTSQAKIHINILGKEKICLDYSVIFPIVTSIVLTYNFRGSCLN